MTGEFDTSQLTMEEAEEISRQYKYDPKKRIQDKHLIKIFL